MFFVFFNYYYFFEKQNNIQIERERERELFHSLGHSPNGCNSLCWTRMERETYNTIQILQRGSRGPDIWIVSYSTPIPISSE